MGSPAGKCGQWFAMVSEPAVANRSHGSFWRISENLYKLLTAKHAAGAIVPGPDSLSRMSGRSLIDSTIPAVSSALTFLICQIVNRQQQAQLADGRRRTIYLCLDNDAHGGGQDAARLWRQRLRRAGQRLALVRLPVGYDPNRFFAEGGGTAEFSRYLEEADQ